MAEGINAERASLSLNGGEPVAPECSAATKAPCRRLPEISLNATSSTAWP
ncbi:hypothetical protein LNQ03_32150 [Klebsiella pneumoniae subsp. pneumoniae]|nr:hypothetical protein [Klebsiella pneumoniae subsp. pneumoniae]